ncbi:focadhesin isoform X2 [Cephus cinctus]|uniref:Focadhesin isoform X2 n=1 Tax=Cephus cinctus TaxID=211228 RepID=A0AAJ7R8P3_CEPCN|nr:focadhesin isoform X2 [Cephus cinctus]
MGICRRNYSAVTVAISNLLLLDLRGRADQNEYLCPFTLKAPQHPLITVLNQKKDVWRDVLTQMQFIMNHHQNEIGCHSVELLRPVYLYILCNPSLSLSESCRQQTWHLLIKSRITKRLQIEALQWMRIKNINMCLETNYRLLELAEVVAANKDKQYCVSLMPFIVSTTIKLLEFNCDPRPNFDIVSLMIECSDSDSCSITVALLAEVISTCPSIYLFSVVQLCKKILEKLQCSAVVAYAMLASLLQWMAYPSFFSSDALEVARKLISLITDKTAWSCNISRLLSNQVFMALKHSDANIQFYTEICYCMESCSESTTLTWLKKIADAPNNMKYRCKLLLSGLFLYSDKPAVTIRTCEILVRIVKENKNFASHLLSLILYKLTTSRDYEEIKALLVALPELAVVKENIPLIIQTLETFLTSKNSLKYLAINLYLKAWENDTRCHRYLQAALVDASKTNKTWRSNVTCAKAMKYICENHPQHGIELVPLLSQTLNSCGDITGSTATALALEGISALCESGLIDICSTWKVLAPKMNKDKRTIVLVSLCKLFGRIPFYPSHPGDKFDKLVFEVITKLWTFVSTWDHVDVIRASFEALSEYKLENMSLKSLPAEYRKDITLPPLYAKTPMEAARKPEDVLPYIPSECWIQMLDKMNSSILNSAGNLLIAFVKEEINAYSQSIYICGQREHNSFNYLPASSVVRAIGDYLRTFSSSSNKHQESTVIECLRIFAEKYPKPLPPGKCSFLENTMSISTTAKHYSIAIACHQAVISSSARTIIENHLATLTTESKVESTSLFKEYLTLYMNLEDLCRGVPPNSLRPFLETSLNYTLEKAVLDSEKAVETFEKIMHCYSRTLKDETIHDANRTLLSIILEGLSERIDVDSKLFDSFVTAAIELSTKHIERMTSPSLWWEVTPQKLRMAAVIRSELLLRKKVESPLNWMNEVIDAAALIPGVQINILRIIQKVGVGMRTETSSAEWTLDFMGQINKTLLDAPEEDSIKIVTFLCDVLLVTTICLSATDCFLANDESLVISRDVKANLFPQAMAILSQKASSKETIGQIMDCLHHIRTSSIPESYKNAFHNALVSLKHERHFDIAWATFLSTKSNVNCLRNS